MACGVWSPGKCRSFPPTAAEQSLEEGGSHQKGWSRNLCRVVWGDPGLEPGGQGIWRHFKMQCPFRRQLGEQHRLDTRIIEQKSAVGTGQSLLDQGKATLISFHDLILRDIVSAKGDTILDAENAEVRRLGGNEVQVGPIPSGTSLSEKFNLAPVRHHRFKREGLASSKQFLAKMVRNGRSHIAINNLCRSQQL